jgi:hypothetical protein
MKYFSRRDFFWILPLSLGLGAVLSLIQPGNWVIGWLGLSFLFLLSLFLLTISTRWAGSSASTTEQKNVAPPLSAATLVLIVALAFGLRLAGGVATYLLLPINGYQDEDDRAGFVFTDAHRRDLQAWDLATSDLPIYDAFSKTYAYDQYGGLLAFSALVYRYISPDAHRPLMLVLLSALMAALGLPFLWKAATRQWEQKIAVLSCWIYALYPESVLLGGAAMREPYLMAFSAFTLWGFVKWQTLRSGLPFQGPRDMPDKKRAWLLDHQSLLWFGLGILGMLLVSPAVALFTLVIFAGWMYFTREGARIPAWAILTVVLVFIAGLFVLSSALDRRGNLGGGTPLGTISNFTRKMVKWDLYQIATDSGRVQKIFNETPEWMHLPFVVAYGVLQPVVIPAFIEPTTLTWRVIAILRALSWWMLLPVLIFSIVAATAQRSSPNGKLWIWITVFTWTWVLFAALRGGGDQWDNPRYRAIVSLWQALLAAYTWVSWRESRNPWLTRILLMEGVLLVFFGEWYADRYFQIGGKMSFGPMVAVIVGLWLVILAVGWIRDHRRVLGNNGKK